MKKLSLLIILLVIISSFVFSTAATEAPAQEATDSVNNIVTFPSDNPVMPCESAFAIDTPLAAGEIRPITECRVTQGQTKLHITNATWYPSMNVEIGFRNQSTLQRYKVDFSNGSISDFTITTPNVPSGSYYVYIRNNGSMSIGSGAVYYELIG